MFMDSSFPVIIVGAGPTGLMLGNLLGMAGIETLILERNAGLSDCPKAIALDDEGLRVCQAVGLGEAVSENLLLDIDAHYVSAGRLFVKVAPTSKRNGYPLISTFHQPEFEAILLDGLERFACVKVWFEHALETFEQTDQGVLARVRTPEGAQIEIACAYLAACDGAKSGVRRALDIPMLGTTFAQKWLVVDCVHDEDPAMVATFFCNPGRPAVTVPAPHKGRRWEFMVLPGEREEELLRTENVQALIQQNGGPDGPDIIRQAIYTFHAVLAKTFSQGRVFLLGDAAHLMPPFGGQGMNCGLRDAHNLGWKVAMVLRGQASPALLETYHVERHAHTAQMIWLSNFLGSIVMPTARPAALMRDMIFHGIQTVPAIREFLTEGRLKPPPRYKKGFMLPRGGRQNKVMAGLMLPQPEVITSRGERVMLDEVLGPGFALLRFYDDPAKAFAPLKAGFWKRLGARFVCVRPGGQAPGESEDCVVVSDSQQEIGRFLRNDRDLFVIVRPDRYIFGVLQSGEADRLAGRLQGVIPR